MNLVPRLLMILGLAFAAPAAAHPGHHEDVEPVARSTAEFQAQRAVRLMIRQKTLDPSWTDLPPVDAQLRDGAEGHQWRVVFKNPAAKPATRRTLVVILTADGKYVSFNHTAK